MSKVVSSAMRLATNPFSFSCHAGTTTASLLVAGRIPH